VKPHEIAMQYINVPFRHRGRTERGLDCIGLIIMVAYRLGLPVFDKKVYGREPSRDGLRESLQRHLGQPVSRPIEIDDVLLMEIIPGLGPSHVAIVAPHPYGLGMVHTYGNIGRVAYQRISDARKNQIIEAYQWPV